MRSPLSHFGIRLPLFLLFGFVYLLIFAIDSSPISSITGWDNSIWRIIGRGWTQGFIPYRDLWDNKGPYQLLIYVIGYLINPGKWGVFILEIINFSFVLELLYRIGRLYTSSWKKLTVAFGCFLLFFVGTAGGDGQTEEWSLCFTLLSLLLYLKYEKSRFINHPYSYTFVYGLCAGVVLLIRPNNAYIIAAVILALIVEYIWDKRFRQLLMHGLTFLGGGSHDYTADGGIFLYAQCTIRYVLCFIFVL